MKSLIILLLVLIASCTSYKPDNYGPCPNLPKQDFIPQSYMPLAKGNSWNYKVEFTPEYLATLNDDERSKLEYEITIELGEKKTIYQNINGEKKPIEAYRFFTNGRENYYHYYVQCDNGVSFVEVNDFENLEIKASFYINNFISDTSQKWDGMTSARNDWIKSSGRASRGNTLECETIEQYIEKEGFLKKGNKKIDPKLFWWLNSRVTFCRGKGITKKELFNEDGELLATMSLVKFDQAVEKPKKPSRD